MEVDMYDGVTYSKKRHVVPLINWSDDRLVYWGWIYARGGRGGIVGDFSARSVQEAERFFGAKFIVK